MFVSIATKSAVAPSGVHAGTWRSANFGSLPNEDSPVAKVPSSPQHQALPAVSTAQGWSPPAASARNLHTSPAGHWMAMGTRLQSLSWQVRVVGAPSCPAQLLP